MNLHLSIETNRLWLCEVSPAMAGFSLIFPEAIPGETNPVTFPPGYTLGDFEQGYALARHYNLGHWAVVRKADGVFIGWCGLAQGNSTDVGELVLRITPAYWKYGLSAEVARACLHHAFMKLGLNQVLASGHKSVGHTLQKAGMQCNVQDGRPAMRDRIQCLINRERWLSLQ